MIIKKVAKLLRSDATAAETRQICIFEVKICSHSARSARAVVNLVQGSFSIYYVTATAVTTSQIKNLIGPLTKNKPAARAARTYEQARVVLCKTTT